MTELGFEPGVAQASVAPSTGVEAPKPLSEQEHERGMVSIVHINRPYRLVAQPQLAKRVPAADC